MNQNMEEQMYDLLYKQAVYGLTEEEKKQLAELEKSANGGMNAHSLELTAATLSLADLQIDEQIPEHLQARILSEADDFFGFAKPKGIVQESNGEIHDSIHDMPTREIKLAPVLAGRRSFTDWFGWAVAAMACVALAVNVYVTRSVTGPDVANTKPTPTPTIEVILTPEQKRQQFIQSSQELARADWTAEPGNVKEIREVSGDVVWSDAKQEGYMRLTGVPVNDPSKETYQLWIIDETQDPKTPIDGGTFDVKANGEVVIPIDARLKARNPKAFAITIEKPGGVVVSERKRLVALAPVKPAQV